MVTHHTRAYLDLAGFRQGLPDCLAACLVVWSRLLSASGERTVLATPGSRVLAAVLD